MSEPDSKQDFVWRFRIDEKAQEPLNADPLLELIRVQWEEMLKLTVPMCAGQPVKVDGFALMRDLATVHPIFCDDPRWRKEP
jgi:hypothetical protein